MSIQSISSLDGVHFRCGKLLLGHPWTDLDKTLGVYRVDPETMHRDIFDFRLRPENRKLEFSRKPDYNPIDSKSFRLPNGWIKNPKFVANRTRGSPAGFLSTPKINAIWDFTWGFMIPNSVNGLKQRRVFDFVYIYWKENNSKIVQS